MGDKLEPWDVVIYENNYRLVNGTLDYIAANYITNVNLVLICNSDFRNQQYVDIRFLKKVNTPFKDLEEKKTFIRVMNKLKNES